MTSKKQLQKFIDEIKKPFSPIRTTTLSTPELVDMLERAVKDLEVLDTLKKHFQVYFDDETENGLEEKVFNGLDLDDIWGEGYDEDFEKIMEWLENGN